MEIDGRDSEAVKGVHLGYPGRNSKKGWGLKGVNFPLRPPKTREPLEALIHWYGV
jgi:hypothetical protein